MGMPELWLLLGSSFMSATLLPGGSEVNLVYLLGSSEHAPSTLIAVATLGNTLGGATNYGLGYLAARGIRISYFEKEQRQGAMERVRRYGSWALLLAWLPIIGDPLCLAAGYLRTNWWASLLFMALGKCLRYITLVYLAAGFV